MNNWKIKKEDEKLQDFAEVKVSDIYAALDNGEISKSEAENILISAIRLVETEINYLTYMTESDDNWFVFANRHLSYRKDHLQSLIEYAQELGIDLSVKNDVTQIEAQTVGLSTKTNGLSRIVWNGKKSDFGRVYEILSPILNCSKTEWERHFMDSKGGDMTKATDIHKGGSTVSQEVYALRAAKKDMEPEV